MSRSLLLIVLLGSVLVTAQDTLSLQEVVLKAPLLLAAETTLPLTARTWSANGNTRSIEKQLSSVPGVWLTNSTNAAQDYRISIRGFGSRAAFGIRGIRISLDGIPQTTPDGQSQIDHLPLQLIRHSEVIRSPAGSRYGNAAGGVIAFSTQNTIKNKASVGLQTGSYGLRYTDISFQQGLSTHGQVIGSVSYQKHNGYREHAGFENKSGFINYTFRKNNITNTLLLLHFDSPYALDPGGLTLEEAKENRTQAREKNLNYDAQESVRKSQLAWKVKAPWKKGSMEAILHYSPREYTGKLPFESGGDIDLDRDFYGASFIYNSPAENKMGKGVFGLDFQQQADHRRRFANHEGLRGSQSMNQIEGFSAVSGFGLWAFSLGKFTADFGLRFDRNLVTLKDQFLSDGNQDSDRKFQQWSPHVGLLLQPNINTSLFASFGTGFEAPALSELSTNPYGAGFNPEVNPMRVNSLDIGVRKKNRTLQVEAVLFYAKAIDEIVRYEIEEFPNQNFYQNLGESKRYGLEIDCAFVATKTHRFVAGMTLASYRFKNRETHGKLPGVPSSTGHFGWHWQQNSWEVSVDGRYVGNYFADNDNQTLIDEYGVAHVKLSKTIHTSRSATSIGVMVFNATNTSYYDNIRINAFGNRYYEPAPEANILISLKTTFN